MFENKIAIFPCTGIGQVVGTIARQAAYQVCDDERPDETVLVCLPALVRGIQEDIDMIRQCPVIVIEGCKDCCATHALNLQEGVAAVTLSIPQIMRGTGLTVKKTARSKLTENEETIVNLVSKRVIEEIDRLKAQQ